MSFGVDYFRLRVGPAGTADTSIAAKSRQADFLFIDVEAVGVHTASTIASALRKLIPEIKSHAATVVRCPRLAERASDGGLADGEILRHEVFARFRVSEDQLCLATLVHHGQRPPSIYSDDKLRELVPSRDVVGALRGAEIRALIDHYDALLTTESVQLLLPNDTISTSFLNVGDVLRSRRDCEILAEWILPAVGPDLSRVVIAVDTPGLLAAVLALELRIRELGGAVVQSIVTDTYPFGGGDSDSLFRDIGACSAICYVLSASRSGRFESLVSESLGVLSAEGTHSSLVVIADMTDGPLAPSTSVSRYVLSTVPRPNDADPGEVASRPTVRVRPATFQLEPEFDYLNAQRFPMVPSRNFEGLLEIFAASRCVGAECSPYSTRGSVRPRSRLITFRVLLEEFSVEVAASMLEPSILEYVKSKLKGLSDTYDAVALPDADLMDEGRGAEAAAALLGDAGISFGHLGSIQGVGDRQEASSILLFIWGSVTGSSAVRSLQELRRNFREATIDCVIIHLRPPSEFEGAHLERVIENGRFVSVWTTVLPWTSMFAPEASRLNRWIAADPLAIDRWLPEVESRLSLIAPTGPDRDWRKRTELPPAGLGSAARSLYWIDPGAPISAEFVNLGWLDDQPTVLLAAASVLEEMRNGAKPNRYRFDFSSVVAENPPVTWVAAIVRQAQAGEFSFGVTQVEQRQSAEYLSAWIEEHDAAGSVLAELLAADAIGKLPSAPSKVFRSLVAEWSPQSPTLRLLADFVAWSRGD